MAFSSSETFLLIWAAVAPFAGAAVSEGWGRWTKAWDREAMKQDAEAARRREAENAALEARMASYLTLLDASNEFIARSPTELVSSSAENLEKFLSAGTRLLSATSRVELIGSQRCREFANEIAVAATREDADGLGIARKKFLDAARKELPPLTENSDE